MLLNFANTVLHQIQWYNQSSQRFFIPDAKLYMEWIDLAQKVIFASLANKEFASGNPMYL